LLGDVLRFALSIALAASILISSTAYAEADRPSWAEFLTEDQWSAIQIFEPKDRYVMTRIAWCESRLDQSAYIIDSDGLPREGAWMVGAIWWGSVSSDLSQQAIQALSIFNEHGSLPWTTRDGCSAWDQMQQGT